MWLLFGRTDASCQSQGAVGYSCPLLLLWKRESKDRDGDVSQSGSRGYDSEYLVLIPCCSVRGFSRATSLMAEGGWEGCTLTQTADLCLCLLPASGFKKKIHTC